MTGPLQISDHLAAINSAVRHFVEDARAAGGAAVVPATPDWDVSDLAGHLGTVHRWATGVVAAGSSPIGSAGDGPNEVDDVDEVERSAPGDFERRLDWLVEGAERLVQTLTDSPPDLKAMVFLKAAPSPREFWARRQAHETTMHRVDALSARLGHLPSTSQTGISGPLAADGVDELLTGFVPRKSTRLHSAEPIKVVVEATDVDAVWTISISEEPPVTTREEVADPDSRITGTAAGLYLGLWNRGDDLAESGTADVLGVWRDKVRIRWR